jgi:hypothetical protein
LLAELIIAPTHWDFLVKNQKKNDPLGRFFWNAYLASFSLILADLPERSRR